MRGASTNSVKEAEPRQRVSRWARLGGPSHVICVGRPYQYSRMDTSDESLMMGVGRSPLGEWLLDFPRCDVTSGGVTWSALMRGFLGGRRCGPLDLKDLTIEIVLTFRVPRSLGPINSGPNNAKTLCFLCVSCLITERYLALCSDNRVTYRPPDFPQSSA